MIYFTVSFSSAQSLSCVRLPVTPWTAACQAPLSMRFSRQEHWSGLPFPLPVEYNGGGSLIAKLCPTLVTPWTAACQAPLSMGFSRQEYWSGLPFPLPRDHPNSGVKRDAGSVPGLERFPGGGNSNPLQYFCLENSMDRGAWQAAVHRVTKSWTQLK